MTWDDDITLCTKEDVLAEIGDLRAIIQGASVAVVVPVKINLVKQWIKLELQSILPKHYNDTVDGWIRYAQYQFDSASEQRAKLYDQSGLTTILPPYGLDLWTGGFFIDTLDRLNMPPRTFYFYGTPDATTFANAAENGSFLVESKRKALYINRGTLAVPAWEIFNAEDLVDYIVNPEVLKYAAVAGTMQALATEGALLFVADYEQNSEMLIKHAEYWGKQYCKRLALAKGLLKIDISGDGIIGDFEKSRMRGNTIWAA